MLTREEIDFHRKVITELRGIRTALEKIAGDGGAKPDGTGNGKEKENDHRPAMKCQSFDEAFFNAFSASFETSTSGGKIGT